jgi:hypothetical protein
MLPGCVPHRFCGVVALPSSRSAHTFAVLAGAIVASASARWAEPRVWVWAWRGARSARTALPGASARSPVWTSAGCALWASSAKQGPPSAPRVQAAALLAQPGVSAGGRGVFATLGMPSRRACGSGSCPHLLRKHQQLSWRGPPFSVRPHSQLLQRRPAGLALPASTALPRGLSPASCARRARLRPQPAPHRVQWLPLAPEQP